MAESIINQLEAALGETVQLLSSFSEKEANTIPFEGSWTAAQVCRHLYLSEKDIDNLLAAPSQAADRQPDEKAEEYKKIFLDYSTKMESPDFIIPEAKDYNLENLIRSLNGTKDRIVKTVHTSKLNEMAPLEEEHPFAGTTKLEIIHFVTYHAMRHNHQIKNIAAALHVRV